MKSFKNSFLSLTVIFAFILSCPAVSAEKGKKAVKDDPEARAIMEKVDARDDGDNMTADMEMILIDKHGKKRIRRLYTFGKDKGKDELSLLFFLHPPDVKNTGFLTHDFDDSEKDDDQFLFLPALHKTKRIASSDKSGSFMGSDLNYSDMTDRDLEDYDYTFYKKKEMVIDDVKVWVIQSLPRTKKVIKETGYKKTIAFIRQDNYVVIRSKSYEDHGGYVKYLTVKKLEQIDGIWTATHMYVKRNKGKHKVHETILKFSNIKYNQKLDYDIFTIRRLEKGM